jgi:hypothetical protein
MSMDKSHFCDARKWMEIQAIADDFCDLVDQQQQSLMLLLADLACMRCMNMSAPETPLTRTHTFRD